MFVHPCLCLLLRYCSCSSCIVRALPPCFCSFLILQLLVFDRSSWLCASLFLLFICLFSFLLFPLLPALVVVVDHDHPATLLVIFLVCSLCLWPVLFCGLIVGSFGCAQACSRRRQSLRCQSSASRLSLHTLLLLSSVSCFLTSPSFRTVLLPALSISWLLLSHFYLLVVLASLS